MAQERTSVTPSLTDLLFDEPGVGRCLVAPDGSVLRANAEWLRSTGFSLDAVLGEKVVDLFPEARDMALTMHARARGGCHVSVPRHAQRIGGKETWWEGSIDPVPMEAGAGLLITARQVKDLDLGGEWLAGDGEMAHLIRAMDWAATSLGARRTWPGSLRTIVNTVVASQFPMALLWGHELLLVYNDAYRGIAADKHPHALGRSTREIWAEVWNINEPIFAAVMERGETIYLEDKLFPIKRRGHFENTYFTLCYSPVSVEDGSIGGTLVMLQETTKRVAELRHAAELLELGDPFCELDREFRILRVNAAHERINGHRREDILGRTHWDVWPETALPSSPYRREYHRCMAERVRVEFDAYYAPLDVWTSVSAYPTEQGGIAIFWRDASERKRAETGMRAAERRYRALFENSLDAVYVTRHDGTILDANRTACELHGMTIDEIRARGRAGLVVPDDRLAEGLAQRASTGRNRGELAMLRKDGTTFLAEVESVTVDPEGQDFTSFVIVRDITERRREEEELRRSHELLEQRVAERTSELVKVADEVRTERQRFLDVLETLPVILVLLRPDYRVVWVNRSYREALGDNVGKLCYQSQFGRDAPCVECQAFTPLRNKKPHNWEWTLPDGRTFDIYNYPFADVDGSPLILEMDIDITERRQAEEALRELNETLERRVTERTAELQESENALREADRNKSEFLSILSHELRNPLAPIRNSLYLLDRAPSGSGKALRAREVIQRQTDHLARLIDDLLDVTRISKGKIALKRSRLDARDVVRRACDDHRTLFHDRNLELRIGGISGPAWIDADETRIVQVVGNLLQNSVKFTPEGGSVTVSVDTGDGQVEIRVRDDGIGIAPELLLRVFEPFVQADGGLARTKGGLGLGLALVKGLVEMHGGSVRVLSKGTDRGAEFIVRLPLASAPEVPALHRTRSTQTKGLEILVIEDNVDSAQSMADVLELEGHRVHVATDGRSGVAKARELNPEVVLCDIGLPDMSGYDVAKTLRAETRARDFRLIALSGYAQAEDVQRALDAGFSAHIAKPPSLETLLELVASGPGAGQGRP